MIVSGEATLDSSDSEGSAGTVSIGNDGSGLEKAVELDDTSTTDKDISMDSNYYTSAAANFISGWSTTVTEAVGKQLGNLSRQATLAASVLDSSVDGKEESEVDEEDFVASSDLLQVKLREKNSKLRMRGVDFVEAEVGRVYRLAAQLTDEEAASTHAHLRESAGAMREASNTIEDLCHAMDEVIKSASKIKFPN